MTATETIAGAGLYRLEQLLHASAIRYPDRCAVRDERSTMTYAELDRAADGVAVALMDGGVSIGDRVGIYVEKSVEAIAAAYGVMRAGAVYVPIDIAAPAGRSAYIARDCGLNAVISNSPGIAKLRAEDASSAPGGICVDTAAPDGFISWSDVQAGAHAVSQLPTVDTDLAYILYTSGSTGAPKGVSISHRSSLTFVRWARDAFELSPADVLSSHAPLHFDLSIFDLFGAAAAGAGVCIVPPVAMQFPVRLADWIRSRQITVWYSVPAALSLLVRYGELGQRHLVSLRAVLFAGEVFPIRYLRELMLHLPQARFFNLYGPTETNVCTYHEVRFPPAPEDPPVPIGRACENTRCQVIDSAGAVVEEPGTEGELVVHGSCVADGYWNDPTRTAERFTAPATYRTGDIVQILESSPASYRFLGRLDHMVKVRGFRVELGDVEAALARNEQVEDCVAVAVPDEILGTRLIAFCTASGSTDEPSLIRACRDQVPHYMVPERIVVMPALPRTSNDKYDRTELARRAAAVIRG